MIEQHSATVSKVIETHSATVGGVIDSQFFNFSKVTEHILLRLIG